MHTPAVVAAFVCGSFAVSVANAGALEDARAQLFLGNVVAADEMLAAILVSPPTTDDAAAHALGAVSRILRAIDGGEAGPNPAVIDSVDELLDDFGFASGGRDVLDWTSSPPRDAEGRLDFPSNLPTGSEVASTVDLALLSAISGALTDLEALPQDFSMTVSDNEVRQFAIAYGASTLPQGSVLEIEYADARLYQAALGAAAAAILVSLAYDVDFDLGDLLDPDVAHDIQQILDADPSLLTLEPNAEALLATARMEALSAIEAYFDASERIRARGFGDGFFHLLPEDRDTEARLRAQLLMTYAALAGCFEVEFEGFGVRPCTWLGTGSRVAPSPRAMLPTFLYDAAFPTQTSARVDTLPDPSFGGVVVDATPAELVRLSQGLLRLRNDRWQDAIPIGNGVVEGSVDAATQDGSSSLATYWQAGAEDDVWYRYTTSATRTIAISGCPRDLDEEIHVNLISVHRSGPGTPSNELDAEIFVFDPQFGYCSTYFGGLHVALAAGQSVLIRVAVGDARRGFLGPDVPSSKAFELEVPEAGAMLGGWTTWIALAWLARRRR